MTQRFTFLNGPSDLFRRDENGLPIDGEWGGPINALEFSVNTEKDDIYEMYTGNGSLASSVIKRMTVSGSFKSNDLSLRAMIAAAAATVQDVEGDDITDEALAPSVRVNQIVYLKRVKVSSLVLKSNSVTLVAGTDYLADLVTGRIKFLTAQTHPVTASYTFADQQAAGILTQLPGLWTLIYAGRNKVDGAPYRVTIHKLRLYPMDKMDLIGDKHLEYTIKFDAYADEFREGDELGQYVEFKSTAN